MEKLFTQLKENPFQNPGNFNINGIPIDGSLVHLYKILKNDYPTKEWADQIKEIVDPEIFEKICSDLGSNKRAGACEAISKYLKAMNVEFN